MRTASVLLYVAFAALICPSCGDGTTSADDPGAIALRMTLPDGHSISQQIDIDYTMQMSVGSREMNIPMLMTMGFTSKAGAAEGGVTPVTMSFDRIKIEMSGMGMNISYDSQWPTDDFMGQMYGRIFGAMMSVPMRMECAEDGTCRLMTTQEELMKAMRDSLPEMSEADLLESTKNMNQSPGTYMAVLPEGPVKPGDTWESEISSDVSGTPMKFENRYKLVEVKDGYAVIELKSDISLAETDVESDSGPTTAEARGSQTGTLHVNVATGWTEEATIKQDIEMKVSQMGMEMPVDLKGEIKISTLERGQEPEVIVEEDSIVIN